MTTPVLDPVFTRKRAHYTSRPLQAVLAKHCGELRDCLHLLLLQAVLKEDKGGVAGAVLVVGKAQRGLRIHGLAKEAAAQQRHSVMQVPMQPKGHDHQHVSNF